MTIQRKPPPKTIARARSLQKKPTKGSSKSAAGSSSTKSVDSVKSSSGDFAVDKIDGPDDREANRPQQNRSDSDGLTETMSRSVTKKGTLRRAIKKAAEGDGPEGIFIATKGRAKGRKGATGRGSAGGVKGSKKSRSKGGSKRVNQSDDAEELSENEGVSGMVESADANSGLDLGDGSSQQLKADLDDKEEFRREGNQQNESGFSHHAPRDVLLGLALNVAPKAMQGALKDVAMSQLESDITTQMANVPRDTKGAPIVREDPFSGIEKVLVDSSDAIDGLSPNVSERARGRSEGLGFFTGRKDPLLSHAKGIEQIVPTLASANAILQGVGKSMNNVLDALGVGAGDNDEGEGGEEEIVEEEEE